MPKQPETFWTQCLAFFRHFWPAFLQEPRAPSGPAAPVPAKPGTKAELRVRKTTIPVEALQFITPAVRRLTKAEVQARAQATTPAHALVADAEVKNQFGGVPLVESRKPEFLDRYQTGQEHVHQGIVDVTCTVIRDFVPKNPATHTEEQEFVLGYVDIVDIRTNSLPPTASTLEPYKSTVQELRDRLTEEVAMTLPAKNTTEPKFTRYFTLPKVNAVLRELPKGEQNFMLLHTVMTKGGASFTEVNRRERQFGVGGLEHQDIQKYVSQWPATDYEVALTRLGFRMAVQSMTETQMLDFFTKFYTKYFLHQRLAYCPLMEKCPAPDEVFAHVVSGKDPTAFTQEISETQFRNWFLPSQAKKPIPAVKGYFTLGQHPKVTFLNLDTNTAFPENVCLDASKGRLSCCLAYTYEYAFGHPVGTAPASAVRLRHLRRVALHQTPDGRVQYKSGEDLEESALYLGIPLSTPHYILGGQPVGRVCPPAKGKGAKGKGSSPAQAKPPVSKSKAPKHSLPHK